MTNIANGYDLDDEKQRAEWYAKYYAGAFDKPPEPEPEPTPPPTPPAPEPEPERPAFTPTGNPYADLPSFKTDDDEAEAEAKEQAEYDAAIQALRDHEEDLAKVTGTLVPDDSRSILPDWCVVPNDAYVHYKLRPNYKDRNPMWRAIVWHNQRVFKSGVTPEDLGNDYTAFKRRMRRLGNPEHHRLRMRQCTYNGVEGTLLYMVTQPDSASED